MKHPIRNLFLAAALLPFGLVPAFAKATGRLEIPFIAQEANYCGPAALAMLANYYGNNVSQDEIASAIYLPEIRGTLTTELGDYARRFNLWVRQYRGSPTDIREKLAARVPLIVLGRFGAQYHYFVILDIDDFAQTVTVHSDTRPSLVLRQEEFFRRWDRADRWTMLVCPPEQARWKLSAEEHNDVGVFLERAGQLSSAADHYRAASQTRPDNSYYRMNLGNALLKQQKFHEAAAAFADAAAIDPENADALNNLAWVYCETGKKLDEAVALCGRAVALRPSRRAYYLDTLGCVLLKQGKTQEAVTTLESALAATTDRQASLRMGIGQRLKAARALLEK